MLAGEFVYFMNDDEGDGDLARNYAGYVGNFVRAAGRGLKTTRIRCGTVVAKVVAKKGTKLLFESRHRE